MRKTITFATVVAIALTLAAPMQAHAVDTTIAGRWEGVWPSGSRVVEIRVDPADSNRLLGVVLSGVSQCGNDISGTTIWRIENGDPGQGWTGQQLHWLAGVCPEPNGFFDARWTLEPDGQLRVTSLDWVVGPPPDVLLHRVQAGEKRRIEVELLTWIPHDRLVDPEFIHSIRTPIPELPVFYEQGCLNRGDLLQPGSASGWFAGDDTTTYQPQRHRVRVRVEFLWDGQIITKLKVKTHFGTTERWRRHDPLVGRTHECSKRDRATETATGTNTGNTVRLHIEARDPFFNDTDLLVAPNINSDLRVRMQGDSANVHWVADRFPSHGFRISVGGRSRYTRTTVQARCIDAWGQDGLRTVNDLLSDDTDEKQRGEVDVPLAGPAEGVTTACVTP